MSLPLLHLPHHDGSEQYLSDPDPQLGYTVSVFVRVPRVFGDAAVHVRFIEDGEARYVEAAVDRADDFAIWWRADLTLRNPVTSYRFLLSGGPSGYQWLNGDGVIDHDPTDAADFRIATFSPPPSWAGDAVFYEVFPDRFAASRPPRDTPSWAHLSAWDEPVMRPSDGRSQLYGGDLPGVQTHLDHIADLGATALYLTPFFPAQSSHRYDATAFDRVDPLLGGDHALARLVEAAHQRGLRVIGDFTANHSGSGHEWFRRAQADADSVEAGFYTFRSHPDDYRGWYDFPSLPTFDHRSPELRRRLYGGPESVVARWLRPPFDLDGWRIDVANMTGRQDEVDLNHDVAVAIRRCAEAVHPEALLVAEHGYDPSDVLLGDGWHGVMNYAGFTRPAWCWLVDPAAGVDFLGTPVPIPRLPGVAVARTMQAFRARIPWRSALHNFNLLDSHDTARFASVTGSREAALAGAGLLLTSPGIPMIFAGDELGLPGKDSHTARTPIPWSRAAWDTPTLDGYRRLIALRRAHPALRRGGLRWAHIGDDALVYLRETADERLLVQVARAGHEPITLPADALGVDGAAAGVLASDDLKSVDGRVTLPADGPAVHVWSL